jgi:plastocyanin
MTARLAAIAVCATLGGGLLAAGCGGGGSSSSTMSSTAAQTTTASGSGAAAVSTDKVEIADFKFDPETVTVMAGTEVTWTNSDDTAHTATADDSSFDTGDLNKGDSKTITFDKPGTFTYYCRFHPFMKATVEVQ